MVSQVSSEATALVISRIVLQDYAVSLKQLEPEQQVKVAQIAIEKIQPRVVAFEDQISIIREDLSKVFEDNEQWVEAAKILIGIPLDSGQRCVLRGERRAFTFFGLHSLTTQARRMGLRSKKMWAKWLEQGLQYQFERAGYWS